MIPNNSAPRRGVQTGQGASHTTGAAEVRAVSKVQGRDGRRNAPPFVAPREADNEDRWPEGATGDALMACAEGLDAWREHGPSPASRLLERVVTAAVAVLARPVDEATAAATAATVRSAAEAVKTATRDGPRVAAFQRGDLARVWRAVIAGAGVRDDARVPRAFVVAAFETRAFNPRGMVPGPADGLRIVSCNQCYACMAWPKEEGVCARCGALLSGDVSWFGSYSAALLRLHELPELHCMNADDATIARGVLRALLLEPDPFSVAERVALHRRRRGTRKL